MRLLPILVLLVSSFANASERYEDRVPMRWNETDSDGLTDGVELSHIATDIVSYAGSAIFIGDMKYKQRSEPFFVYPICAGTIVFYSWHSSITGWQQMYVFENKTAPVGFTIPHSESVPVNATTTGFRTREGGLVTFKGENKFVGCQTSALKKDNTYQIWWQGGEPAGEVECSRNLTLYVEQRHCCIDSDEEDCSRS